MRRIRELDALRGVWSILIFWFHATLSPYMGGWSRVDLFFVLSGYLTTLNLLRTDRAQPTIGAFYAKRLLRILPAYYVLLFIVVALDRERWAPDHVTGLLYALTLNQNTPHYWSGEVPRYFPQYLVHTWFLGVELQFCLLWFPLVLWLGRRSVVPLALWGLLNALLLRLVGLHPWTFFARCDGLALGAMVAVLLSDRDRSGRCSTQVGLLLATSVALAYLGYDLAVRTRYSLAFDHPLDPWESLALLANNVAYAGMVGLIACHAGHPALAPLRGRLLGYAGAISYGVYLYGLLILSLVREVDVYPVSACPALFAFVLLLGAAALFRECIERPLLERWVGRHTGGNPGFGRSASRGPAEASTPT